MRECVVCGVGVRRGVAWGVRSQVVGMAASRFWRTRFRRARASGAGDAVNGKYEKKTVTVDAPRYQVVLVDTNLGSADMHEALHQDFRIKK